MELGQMESGRVDRGDLDSIWFCFRRVCLRGAYRRLDPRSLETLAPADDSLLGQLVYRSTLVVDRWPRVGRCISGNVLHVESVAVLARRSLCRADFRGFAAD